MGSTPPAAPWYDGAMESNADAPHSKEPVHDLIAILLASGRFSDVEIAERAACSPTLVQTLRESPLFQALVDGYRQRFSEKAIERVLDDVFADTRANFEWLRGLRGTAYDDDPKRLRLQLRASEVLFDRQVPKRVDNRSDVHVGVVLEPRLIERLDRGLAVMAPKPALDVTPAPPCGTGATSDDGPV